MKKYILALGLSMTAIWALVAEPVEYRLWDAVAAPTSNELEAIEDASNPDWITGVSDPSVTIYPADKPNGMALLMCPGGAYFGLAAVHEGSGMAKDLNENGITLAVLKYRMPNYGHYQVPADDARRAYTLLVEHAAEFGIDPARIGIGGASAGGHLASTVATHKVDGMPLPAFQVLYYPVITMKEGVTHGGSRENLLGRQPSPELVDQYSNELRVTPATPPAIILVSANDDVVPLQNSMDYYHALIKNGVPASLHVYPDGGHGWAFRPAFTYDRISTAELLLWLKQFEK